VTSWNDQYQSPQIEHCAGDLVDLDRVDTAGHCGAEGWYAMRVFWGDASRGTARVVEVDTFIQHAGYSGAGDPRDLGVLMLSEALPEGTLLRRYATDAEALALLGQPVPIASWGLTGPPQDAGSVVPDNLLETRVRIVSVDDVLVEAEAIGGSGDCQGGSGTGLGDAVTLGRFSGVYPSPSGKTCDHDNYRMSFVAPGYAKRWGDAVAAAWRKGRS